MTPQMALDLVYLALTTTLKLSAPILAATIVVGVLVNILQTVTSIRDMSLTFVPKLVAAGVVIAFTLPWGIQVMISFFRAMYSLFGRASP
jgi:flagellar biosynthesis protein FliQ